MRFVALSIALLGTVCTAAATSMLLVDTQRIASPAAPGSTEPVLTEHAEVLCWIEHPSAAESRVLTSHWQGGAWTNPVALGQTQITVPSTAEAPIATATAARWVSTTWYSTSQHSLQFARSSDHGEHFLPPTRVDDGHPLAVKPALVQFLDGTALVAWVEQSASAEAALWLRRVLPDDTLSVPVLIGTFPSVQALGMAHREDSAEADVHVVLVASTGDPAGVMATFSVVVHPPDHLATANPCARCPPADETSTGDWRRGRIEEINTAQHTVRLRTAQDRRPAVFSVDPAELKRLAPQSEIIGRRELRADGEWLLDLRIIQPIAPSP